MKQLMLLFLILSVFLAPLVSAGEIKFNPDRSKAHLIETDVDINLNLSNSFSDFNVYDDRIKLDYANFSVRNTSKNSTSVDLHKWNLSKGQGRNMVNFSANTSANHTVKFEFENLTADENYTVRENDSFYTFLKSNSSGDIEFNYSNWSRHNFSLEVTYLIPAVSLELSRTSIDPGETITIECSSSDEDGISSTDLTVYGPENTYEETCGTDFDQTDEYGDYTVNYTANDTTGRINWETETLTVNSPSTADSGSGGGGGGGGFTGSQDTIFVHKWTGTGQKFSREEIQKQINAIRKVDIETRENVSGLELRIDGDPEVRRYHELNNSYRYIEINVSGAADEEIENASVEFDVNRSFYEQYDRIDLHRYENGWSELPTTKITETETSGTFRAYLPGFSLFGIAGEDDPEPETSKNVSRETNTNESENETCKAENCLEKNETAEASNETFEPRNGTGSSISEDIMSEIKQRSEIILISFLSLSLATALAAGTVLILRSDVKKQRDLEKEIRELKNRIRNYSEENPDEDIEDIKEKLNEVQRLLLDDKYAEAEELVQEMNEELGTVNK